MANNREISQFAGLVTVNDNTNVSIGASLIVGTGIVFNAGSSTAQFDARVDVGSTSYDKHSLVAVNNSHQTVVVAVAHSTAACFEGRSDASTTTSLIDNDGCLKIGGTLPSSPNIQLRADGSATLTQVAQAACLQSNGNNVIPPDGSGVEIFKNASAEGVVQAYNRDGSAYLPLKVKGSNFELTAAGIVKSADGVQGGGNASCGWQLDPGSSTGLISVQGKSTGAATNAIFQGWYGSDNTIRFNCSGDATFDGHIGVGTPFRSNESRIESAFDSSSTVGLVLRNSSTGTCARIIYGSTIIGSITNTSTVTSYNTTSDYRLKENVVGISGAIDRVKQLSPKRFNFKVDEDVTVDGFIAHEVSSIVPEAISGEKDAMRDEEYEVTPAVEASEGVDAVPAVMRTRSVPDYQGIDQSKLIPLLTAALQEAITKIETLETKVAALEGS